MFWVDFICVFIVVYLLWMCIRWLVLPHLRIFPYIQPQWLWVTAYNTFSYVMNMLFFWIILFLIIVYITWLIIRRLPNFPIPLRRILLRLSPWRPLIKAGVLPLMDNIRKIVWSTDALDKRLTRTAAAFGEFFNKSFSYLSGFVKSKSTNQSPPAGGVQFDVMSDAPPVNDRVKQTVSYEPDEINQIQDEYLQCIEQDSVPVYEGSGIEIANAMARNQMNRTMCKLQSFTTYSNLLNNRISM